ncbi:MAG: hypothetical protein QXR18_02835 [Pyrobaculum sp.]
MQKLLLDISFLSLIVASLLIVSNVAYFYLYIRDISYSPLFILFYLSSITLGVLTVKYLRNPNGFKLIVTLMFSMIRIRTDIDRLLRYIAFSLGVFSYASVSILIVRWALVPLHPMWLFLLGVAILFYGFLQFISEKLHIEVVTRIIGNLLAAATAALLSLNLIDINFTEALLVSIIHTFYGLLSSTTGFSYIHFYV